MNSPDVRPACFNFKSGQIYPGGNIEPRPARLEIGDLLDQFTSGSPVSTWTSHGWLFIEDGARLASSMISRITAFGTASFLKPLTLRRLCTNA
jgi:hypothetical protein